MPKTALIKGDNYSLLDVWQQYSDLFFKGSTENGEYCVFIKGERVDPQAQSFRYDSSQSHQIITLVNLLHIAGEPPGDRRPAEALSHQCIGVEAA